MSCLMRHVIEKVLSSIVEVTLLDPFIGCGSAAL